MLIYIHIFDKIAYYIGKKKLIQKQVIVACKLQRNNIRTRWEPTRIDLKSRALAFLAGWKGIFFFFFYIGFAETAEHANLLTWMQRARNKKSKCEVCTCAFYFKISNKKMFKVWKELWERNSWILCAATSQASMHAFMKWTLSKWVIMIFEWLVTIILLQMFDFLKLFLGQSSTLVICLD